MIKKGHNASVKYIQGKISDLMMDTNSCDEPHIPEVAVIGTINYMKTGKPTETGKISEE